MKSVMCIRSKPVSDSFGGVSIRNCQRIPPFDRTEIVTYFRWESQFKKNVATLNVCKRLQTFDQLQHCPIYLWLTYLWI